jgi:hypothetical protein
VGVNRNIRITEPSAEMLEKIIRARQAIAAQKPRYIKCPYCQHNAIVVYEDTRGHVETKCKKCGKITVFNVLSMRRIVLRLH